MEKVLEVKLGSSTRTVSTPNHQAISLAPGAQLHYFSLLRIRGKIVIAWEIT